ncbi:MAG: FtsQ-type POTRA domain-containing protein [Undibacterium sp.]|nr:FtsQ-type POTRA domain-containing protein [Opitutaceae bacterium]
MRLDTHHTPAARSWRDIPQPVKPRAMSREGRRRLVWSTLRFLIAVSVLAGVAVGGWQVTLALRENPRNAPAVAAVPVSAPKLETDGFLAADPRWLARTLALPKNATLMGLDLEQLRDRLLAQGQVNTAVLTKIFPATLKVRVTERSPIARVMAQVAGGKPQAFLVARDGVVFAGIGYEAELLNTLPWLEPLKLARDGDGFLPISGMGVVAELLGKAKLEAEHLYATWRVVSLARLNTDAEIDVRTASGATVVFSATSDYFSQIANLDLAMDKLTAQGAVFKRINLANGRDVTVTMDQPIVPIAPAGKSTSAATPAARKAATPHLPAFGNFSTNSKTTREF